MKVTRIRQETASRFRAQSGLCACRVLSTSIMYSVLLDNEMVGDGGAHVLTFRRAMQPPAVATTGCSSNNNPLNSSPTTNSLELWTSSALTHSRSSDQHFEPIRDCLRDWADFPRIPNATPRLFPSHIAVDNHE